MSGSTLSYSDTGLSASTSYSYRVRANDAAGNLGNYSNTASATTPTPTGPTPVAAYAFDEGSGTTVADASGNGNNGTVANATWAAAGKYGKALSFNGSSSRVTIPDAASLHLTSAVTLEAWVNPATVNANWRDVVYKGDDNYYLMATSSNSGRPAAGAIIGGSYGEAYGTANLADRHLDAPRLHLRRIGRTPLRERNPGREHRQDRKHQDLDQPAHDRQRRDLRPVLLRADRRRAGLQHRPHPGPDPIRHDNPGRAGRPRRPAAVGADVR